jgi:hypothetical protein
MEFISVDYTLTLLQEKKNEHYADTLIHQITNINTYIKSVEKLREKLTKNFFSYYDKYRCDYIKLLKSEFFEIYKINKKNFDIAINIDLSTRNLYMETQPINDNQVLFLAYLIEMKIITFENFENQIIKNYTNQSQSEILSLTQNTDEKKSCKNFDRSLYNIAVIEKKLANSNYSENTRKIDELVMRLKNTSDVTLISELQELISLRKPLKKQSYLKNKEFNMLERTRKAFIDLD